MFINRGMCILFITIIFFTDKTAVTGQESEVTFSVSLRFFILAVFMEMPMS
jgi:hypothetical protein